MIASYDVAKCKVIFVSTSYDVAKGEVVMVNERITFYSQKGIIANSIVRSTFSNNLVLFFLSLVYKRSENEKRKYSGP